MSGADNAAPPPSPSPPSSTPSLPHTITPFITPTGVGGVRFPIYATIQGVNSPLIYSPTLFGQNVLPWRPIVTTPTTAGNTTVSGVSGGGLVHSPSSTSSLPPTSSVVTGYATSFTQLPGFMYPVPSLNMPLVMTDTSKKGEVVSVGGKRRSETSSEGSEDTKRARVTPATTTPHSAGSSSPSPQPPLLRPTPHRSPVIKYNLLPYNIGGTAVVAGSPGQQTTPTSLPQTAVILSLAPQVAPLNKPHPLTTPPTTSTPLSSTPPTLIPTLPLSILTPSLPPNILLTLLRCFGPLQVPACIPPGQLVTSELLSDLYRSSYHSTSELTGSLSPESCALLTISYLSSLRRGERVCVESLHTMLKYARTGESEWLQYYKRHKKMSESTFVQSQLMHLSRISVYPALGRVRVMISNEHLGQGIALTIKNLTQLISVSSEALPDYVVVLAVRANVGVEFCVLVLEPLQAQLLLRQQKNKVLKNASKGGGSLLEGRSLSSAGAQSEMVIEKRSLLSLRRMQRRLKGKVHVPFLEHGNGSTTVSQSEAEVMTPTTSHVIEHKPGGPYQDQYNIAMHLMGRIAGLAEVKLDNFRTLDFCILCPPEETFMRSVKREIIESGLGDLVTSLEGGGARGVAEERVIGCWEQDYAKFSRFLNQIHTNQETLYLVVVEHADLTSTLGRRGVANDTVTNNDGSHGNCCYGEHKILLGQANVVMLYVSSRPYRLVTNRFLVSASNEIHYPLKPHVAGGEVVEFGCVSGLPGETVRGAGPGGVVVCEDERMEEEFHAIAIQQCPGADFLHIRHQLLLNDYISALAGHAHSTSPAHPCTQSIVRCLVEGPLTDSRGRGSMLLIRSHDTHMGRQFFSKLLAARDALGLQFRFEMILDTGREGLKLSPHFMRRVVKSGSVKTRGVESGCYSNGCDGNHGDDDEVTHSDLDNLPCIVVMTGKERPHLPLPSSLRWVDLRLLYPTDITRSVYEAELAWGNGHFPSSHHHTLTHTLTSTVNKEVMSSESRDSLRPHPPVTPLSSSSSRRSSVTDVAMATEEERGVGGGGGRGVVEWRGTSSSHEDTPTVGIGGVASPASRSDDEELIDVSDLPSETPPTVTMTTTVLIDPPEDQVEEEREGGTWSYSQSSVLPNHWNRTESASNHSTTTDNLFASLSDSESDSDDEEEPLPITRTCLLPRPFYHIWTSRNPHQPLLLPPATGIEWASPYSKHRRSSHSNSSSSNATTSNGTSSAPSSSGGSHTSEKPRRPPLFDPDPAHQTSYYRKWTKPGNSVIKKALDMLLRATISGMKRRFLLTGPSQVGKTGVWLLLVRLLHDHLRSSHSVSVENPPLQHSIILQGPTSAGGGGRCSRVVAPGYLKKLYEELLNDEKPFPSSPPHQTTPTQQATPTTVLTLSPYRLHDNTHSCASCSDTLRSHSTSNASILSQRVSTSHDSHMTIRWYIPPPMTKYCVIDEEKQVLERLCLPPSPDKLDLDLFDEVPIFTPSLTRGSSALLNLAHSGAPGGLHVVVTTTSEMHLYMGAWPGHVIMALPNKEVQGKGMMYCRLKQFLHHNYQANLKACGHLSPPPLPWTLVMSDSCVMWRRLERNGDQWRSCDQSLSQVLQILAQQVATSNTPPTVVSIPQWSSSLSSPSHPHSSHPHSPHLTQHDINHDFFLFNVAMTTDIHYRTHSYTSYDVDFNLQLYVGGVMSAVCSDVFVVKKFFPPNDSLALHSNVTTVATAVDDIAMSLHDTVASLVDYPGPYLLEHYLRLKSQVLFPSAHSPIHPVLMIDHYIDLGSHTHISFLQSTSCNDDESDKGNHTHSLCHHSANSSVKFGGLVLYLCEGRVAKQQLRHVTFVPGSCLCLVTHSSGSLVSEVGRLDLEERWKIRLRDEYKTACSHDNTPLYFLIGHFGV